MIIKYVITLAVLLLVAVGVPVGVPARPVPARQPGPAHCASGCTCGCTPARASPPSSACGCAGAGSPRCAARGGSAGRCRCGTGCWRRASTRCSLGRAHWRHGLRVPLEEHVLVMAPPRTFKTAFLADVILRYPGPVISTTTKADVLALTAAVRAAARPGARVQPAAHRRRRRPRSAGPRSTAAQDPATAIRRADAFAFAVSQQGRRRRHVLVRQGQ